MVKHLGSKKMIVLCLLLNTSNLGVIITSLKGIITTDDSWNCQGSAGIKAIEAENAAEL